MLPMSGKFIRKVKAYFRDKFSSQEEGEDKAGAYSSVDKIKNQIDEVEEREQEHLNFVDAVNRGDWESAENYTPDKGRGLEGLAIGLYDVLEHGYTLANKLGLSHVALIKGYMPDNSVVFDKHSLVIAADDGLANHFPDDKYGLEKTVCEFGEFSEFMNKYTALEAKKDGNVFSIRDVGGDGRYTLAQKVTSPLVYVAASPSTRVREVDGDLYGWEVLGIKEEDGNVEKLSDGYDAV